MDYKKYLFRDIVEVEASRNLTPSGNDIQDDYLLKRLVLICIVIILLVSGVSLAGWISGWLIVASISDNFIPMSPSAALSFIFLSLALLIQVRYPEQHRIRIITASGVLMILLICSVILLDNVTGIRIDIERILISNPLKFGNVRMGRMSPVTACNFLMAAFSLFLMLISPAGRKAKGTSVTFAIVVALTGFWVSLSYLYGTFVLYETTIIPVAVNTAVAFMILGLGIIAAAGTSCWPVSSLIGPSLNARLLRSFLPVTIAFVLIFGWLSNVIFMRFLDPELIAAVAAILSITLISFAVSKIAKTIGGQLDLADAERKLVENERATTVEFLRLVNNSIRIGELVRVTAIFFQQQSGCQAVGIRLREGNDYPYFEARGFPQEFVRAESSLCIRDNTGSVVRDSSGYPFLECMCGNVISGRFDPAKSFFTPHGSFWTNNTTQLLSSTTEADRQGRTRNRCKSEGYESVALIPLRVGEQSLGLLQLNDRKKNVFSPEAIAVWERLADHLAVALVKFRSEETLRQSEERYRSLFENILNGLAYCRMLFEDNRPQDFICLDVNGAFEKLTGLKNVVGKRGTEVIPGIRESDPGLFELCGRVALTGKPEKIEIYVAALSGWFSISVYSPKKEHVIAIFDIITERKRAEEALQKSEERYRRITEAISDYIYKVLIENGKPVEMTHSEACFAVTGHTSQEFAADPSLWFKMVMEKDHHLFRKQTDDVLSGRYPHQTEYRIIRKDGKICWVESTVVPNYDINGTLISYDGILRDFTERKNLESQLLHAQKMEAVGHLAGGIAHDFNNILSAIVNYTYIIKSRMNEDDPALSQIEQISSLSMKASEITKGLLTFSRKHFIDPIPMNFNNAVINMERLLTKFIGEDIQLIMRLSDKDLTIMADSAQIEQLIINFATNARDAMPDGGSLTIETNMVTIDDNFVRLHGYGRPGTYALLSVTDTGTGMDAETKQRIFEPFFTTKEAGKGTGLGLAIIYGIVKQYDGYINVYSEQGMGTTFRIYFHTVTLAVPEKEETKTSDLSGNAETILLAEDEEAVRNSLQSILEKFGYRVIPAFDGEDALEKFRDHHDKIDLLLLDVIMPKRNGREVYEKIKKITPGIKAIFTSGYSADIIDKKGLLKDNFKHIVKPVSVDRLLAEIKEALHSG